MSDWLTPPRLFNPITSGETLAPTEVLTEVFAGPFGLLAFIPLLPLVWLVARWDRRTALLGGALVWMLATLRIATTGAVIAWLAAAVGWVLLLNALRRRGWLGKRGMIALVWVGLHALVLPLWWAVHDLWYPGRMAVLHAAGLAYLMLRIIAWGVSLANEPGQPMRLVETACWLLYAPCMRLGPLMLREQFLERYDSWDPRRPRAWKAGARRGALFLLGGVALGFVAAQLPKAGPGEVNIFSAPQAYDTNALLRAFYLIPIHIYLLLWTYNELAAMLGHWLGIPVDNNFNWLPRATSVRDFWRRWHVTLGTWLREYLYIPLGGNRRHVPLNYLAVFGYCGAWHGPSWSFVAWGLAQAAALMVQRWWDRLCQRLGWARFLRGRGWTAVCWLLTMHFAIVTIVVFVDFEHLGLRLFAELLRRMGGAGNG